jgi:hypothetical protein
MTRASPFRDDVHPRLTQKSAFLPPFWVELVRFPRCREDSEADAPFSFAFFCVIQRVWLWGNVLSLTSLPRGDIWTAQLADWADFRQNAPKEAFPLSSEAKLSR